MAVIDKVCPNVIVELRSHSNSVLLLQNELHSNTFVNNTVTIDGGDAIAWCNQTQSQDELMFQNQNQIPQ